MSLPFRLHSEFFKFQYQPPFEWLCIPFLQWDNKLLWVRSHLFYFLACSKEFIMVPWMWEMINKCFLIHWWIPCKVKAEGRLGPWSWAHSSELQGGKHILVFTAEGHCLVRHTTDEWGCWTALLPGCRVCLARWWDPDNPSTIKFI